jgi:hypothetical protein
MHHLKQIARFPQGEELPALARAQKAEQGVSEHSGESRSEESELNKCIFGDGSKLEPDGLAALRQWPM